MSSKVDGRHRVADIARESGYEQDDRGEKTEIIVAHEIFSLVIFLILFGSLRCFSPERERSTYLSTGASGTTGKIQ